MKKNFSRVMLVAAAAIAFFACQKQEAFQSEFEEVNGLTFTSEKPSYDGTKTQWVDETKTIQWSAGDKIRVAYTCGGVWQNADGTSNSGEESGNKTAKIYESKAITEAGSTASFSVPGYFKGTAEGVYVFYGIYPSSLVSSADIKYAPSVTIDIPAEQTPSASSFDCKADVMASKSDSYKGIPKDGEDNGTVSLKWERLSAHGHFTLKSLAVVGEENIQSITLTADADADMVGTHYLYLDTYNVVKANSNAKPNALSIDARNLSIDANGNVTFWASFLPCTWNSISVRVETDKATYTLDRDLVALNKTKTFAKNARNVLAINMTEANRAVKNASSLPFVKDFSDKTGTNGITELDGFTVSGSVYNAAGAIRLAKGEGGGSITTQSLDLSCDFHVKVTASGWNDNELALIVSSGDQSETVILSAVGNGNSGPGECAEHIINFQPVSNSSSVTFAADPGKRCYIKKIEILEGHAVAVPVLKATAPNEIAAAGGEGSFNFTLANPQDGQSVSAESNVDWITGESVSGNTVTYTVAENTSEESREGTITLSYEGAESVDVTITQAAKPSADAPVEVTDVLTPSVIGVSGSSYAAWSNKKLESLAVYAGNSSAGTGIQLKSNDSTSGIITTSSGGTVSKIIVKWHSSTNLGRTLDIYGKSTAYTAPSDLYVSNDKGTKIGSIVKGTSTELVVDGEYQFIGLRSNSGALYLEEIQIVWESGNTGGNTTDPETPGEGGETPDPEEPETPTPGTSTTQILTAGDSSAGNWTSGSKTSSAKVGDVSFTALGTGGNDSKYYSSDYTWRFYTAKTSGVKVSVPAGSAITNVVITVTKGTPSTPSGCTVTSANLVYTYAVSGSPTELSFYKLGSANLQINKIEVTYTK